MKTLEEILKSEPVFYGEWKNKEDVFETFELSLDHRDINILFGAFYEEYFPGDAHVIFEKDGELYEALVRNSSYGLQGTFEPEKVVLEYTEKKLSGAGLELHDIKLKKFLNIPLSEEEMKEEHNQQQQ